MNTTDGYRHRRGIHCESACQCAILAAAGHEVPEDVVFGLDGGFGFSFHPAGGAAPDIVVGKQAIMPLRAARLLGVEVAAHTPRTGQGLAKLLESAPAVMARVDLGLLPHWGMAGRSSFGGYFVNVVRRVDDGAFEISDPAFDAPVTVSDADLEAARSSRASPPLNPDRRVYVFGVHAVHGAQSTHGTHRPSDPPRGLPPLDRIGPVAVRTLCREVLRPGSRSLGVPGMKSLASAATAWPRTKQGEAEDVDPAGEVVLCDALARQLLHLGRQIETFGTGGGLFRPMIARFLTRVAEATDDPRYTEAAHLFTRSGEDWGTLGRALLAKGATGSREDLTALTEAVAETARSAMDIEKRALTALTTV